MSDFNKDNLFTYKADGTAVWYWDVIDTIPSGDGFWLGCRFASELFGLNAAEVAADAYRRGKLA